MKHLSYETPPADFKASFYASGCYCSWKDKILFLRRHPNKPYGETWCVPGGKWEEGETPRTAIIREVREEVGLNVDDEGLILAGHLYCRLPDFDYVYYMFWKRFDILPDIDLALEEHLEAIWVTYEEALQLPLIVGEDDALKYCKNVIFSYSRLNLN